MKEQDERRLRELIEEARADPDVSAVLMFGSEARGEPARDVDVAIVLGPDSRSPLFDVQLRYAGYASGRRHEGIDASVFQALPVNVRVKVLRDAVPLLVKDEAALYRLARATAREWEDLRPRFEIYLEAIARGWA